MANVLSLAPTTSPPEDFVEALNGLGVGIVGVQSVRRALAAALAADSRSVAVLQGLMDDAYQAGRLADDDYEALSRDIGIQLGEDVPTEWSEEVVNEAAPSSDTARPGGADGGTAARDARPAALFPGAILRDRFVLQSRLDSGGMSEVYKALDRRRQEAGAANPWLAIKLVSPSNARYAESLQALQHEATLARELDHPGIVRVLDFDRDGDHAFITMECLEGESLAELLTRQRYRPLTIARARQIMAETGAALEFAHARGVTHADVKPGNIFLTRDGAVKLLDFGNARSTSDSAARAATAARTPAYASCEVLEGRAATPQDDVYSAACVAYRMLAGRRVFGHHDALAAETAGRRPAPIRTLTAAQWSSLEHALAFRRENRTPGMAAFLSEFNRAAPVAPTAVPAATDGAALPQRPPSRARLAWGGIAAASVAVAIVMWRGTAPGPAAHAAAATDAPAPVAATADGQDVVENVPQPVSRSPNPAQAPPDREARHEQPVARMDPDSHPARKQQRAAAPGTDGPLGSAPARASDAGTPAPAEPAASNGASMPTAAQGGEAVPAAATAIALARNDADTPIDAPAPPLDGGVAQSSTPATPAAPAQVPLSSLKFSRYVEPTESRWSDGPDPAGWVELSFLVGADGRTRDITILDATPPDRYEDAALAAVKRWRFEPPTEDGRPVERRTGVRLRFQPE